jgi:hypothetical protein
MYVVMLDDGNDQRILKDKQGPMLFTSVQRARDGSRGARGRVPAHVKACIKQVTVSFDRPGGN